MDAEIAALIGSDGASMYGSAMTGGPIGPAGAGLANVGGGFKLSGSAGANGTAIVLIVVVIGLAWFYWANRGMMR